MPYNNLNFEGKTTEEALAILADDHARLLSFIRSLVGSLDRLHNTDDAKVAAFAQAFQQSMDR